MKWIGLLLTALAGIGLGVYAALRLYRRAAWLEQAAGLVRFMAAQIRYTAAPVGELLDRAAGAAEFTRLTFLADCRQRLSRGDGFRTAWPESLREQACAGGANGGDCELMQRFGEELGATDVEGQLASCRLYAERLGERLAAARRAAAEKGRLYVTLGAAGGLAAVLLLW